MSIVLTKALGEVQAAQDKSKSSAERVFAVAALQTLRQQQKIRVSEFELAHGFFAIAGGFPPTLSIPVFPPLLQSQNETPLPIFGSFQTA